MAGVQGNGQTELAEALTGLRPVASGEVAILGHDMSHATPRQITETGTGHIPEDRQKHGLVLSYPVRRQPGAVHLLPGALRQRDHHQRGAVNQTATELVREFDIRTPSILTRRRARCRAATSRK